MINFIPRNKKASYTAAIFLVLLLCFQTSPAHAENAMQKLQTESMKKAIQELKIEITPNEFPIGVDEQTALEIKTISSVFNSKYKNSEKIFLGAYKNVAFLSVPSKQIFMIFPPQIDAKTANLMGRGGKGKETYDTGLSLLVDKNAAYQIVDSYQLLPLEDVDVSTLKEINTEYFSEAIFKDKNHVYQLSKEHFEIMPNADPATFAEVTDEHSGAQFTDKDSVFLVNKEHKIVPVTDADIATFQRVTDSMDDTFLKGLHSYIRDKNHRYYFSPSGAVLPIQNIDSSSIRKIFGTIYEQNNNVYYTTLTDPSPIKLEGVDPREFKPISKTWNLLFTDGKKIFSYHPSTLQIKEIPGITNDTFKVYLPKKVDYPNENDVLIFGDKNNIFYMETKYSSDMKAQIIPIKDHATFEIISHYKILLGKDSKAIYAISGNTLKPLPKINAKKFEVLHDLNALLAKDDKNVYTINTKTKQLSVLRGVNPKAFSIAGYFGGSGSFPLIKDNKHVWYFNRDESKFKILKDADPVTFISARNSSGNFYKDKSHTWKDEYSKEELVKIN